MTGTETFARHKLCGPAALVIAAAVTPGANAIGTAPGEMELRVLKPTADTYVTAASPRTNFGRLPRLRVDGSPETTAYLRFRVRKLPGQLESVTLLLRSEGTARGSYAVRGVTEDEWAERRLTYSNAPELSLRYASSRALRRGAWSAIDVTSFVDGTKDEETSIAITTRGVKELAFGSRESRNGPKLVLRFTPRKEVTNQVIDSLRRR